MLKQITLRNIPGITPGKIIKHSDIVSYQNFNQIHDHARRHARHILNDAQGRITDLQNQAWTEGYVSGIAFAIQDLAKFVNDSENHKNRLINSALEILSERLKSFFDDAESVCHLLSILAERLANDSQEPARINVTVPEKLHPHSLKIKQIFTQAGLATEIKKSPLATIVVEYGKEIWTYDINQVADNLTREAVKMALSSGQLNKACEQSSLDALRDIRDTLDNYLTETGVADSQ